MEVNCDAAIRPFPNDTEVHCERAGPPHDIHEGVLRDYAYKGSVTVMQWDEGDRRTFHREWPGPCANTTGCVLPDRHQGGCAT